MKGDREAPARSNSIRVLREANRYLVYQCVMKEGPLSVERLIRLTGLSRPTVLHLLRDLMDSEIIVKDGFADSATVGRSASLLNLNRQNHFALGIDFEFPAIRMAIANMKNDILAEESFLFPENMEGEELKELFYARVEAFVASSGVDRSKIDGAGLGISGVIDSAAGVSLSIERIRGWKNVPVQADLERILGVPVYVRNDVHLLGMVEKELYLPGDFNDFIYVAVRTGIGSITYQHGRAMRGEKGNAGFIGHTIIIPRGRRCHCGSCGCLETYAGQTAIANAYLTCSHEPVDFDEVIRRAEAGETLAVQTLRDAGFYLGIALANLVKTFEIPEIVIGGNPALGGSPFITAAEEALREYSTDSLNLDIRIRAGQLREDQYPLGGCHLVMEHRMDRPRLSLQPAEN